MPKRFVDSQGAAINSRKVADFRDSLSGRAILPEEEEYETARRIWNASIERYPGLIVRCADASDVAKTVNFARANHILVAVRGGGHNVGGRALCDDGMVIDLSMMREIRIDPQARIVRAQAGCTLGDLDGATHAHGLTVPVGVISKTGIAGLTLGGGVGWLVRKYGLTCDNVLAFEVVTANGEIVTASADANQDLFWGLRGGGGNFGVVVEFTYRAHPVSTVLGGLLVYAREQAGQVLRLYRELIEKAPDELTAYAALLHTPDGAPAVAIIPCWCGDPEEGERVLKPVREFGPPLMDAVQVIPFPQQQSMLDDAFPNGNQNYWKSTFVRDFSDAAIDILVDHANRAPSPLSMIVIEFYGGAASRIGPEETAFAQRQADYDVGILAQWPDRADTDQNVAWTRAVFDALQPHASGAFLLNFLDQEEDAVIRASFGGNYERLVQLKQKYDPANFFRQNHNVRPS